METNDEQPSSALHDDTLAMDDETSGDAHEDLDFSALETPEELTAHVRTAHDSRLELPPALERDRPDRLPLIPAWLWPALATFVLLIGIGVGAWFMLSAAARVEIPDVTGRPYGLARTMLAQKGLEAAIVERRFSARPVDQVLAQEPVPGSVLKRGDTVSLIVSAGTEETSLPDVIGDGIILARGTLESLGLVVVEETVPSEIASDTVLGTIPAPGTIVRSGDVVRVQVSAPLTGGAVIKPYDMQGLTIAIDPAPLEDAEVDITLEVSRRLRSLLEASGATVVVLRGTNATSTADTTRAKQAQASRPTLAVGFSAVEKGPGGRTVKSRSDDATASALTAQLADAATKQLAGLVPPAVEKTGSLDSVFRKVEAPWIRVGLGSFADPADESAFSDPRWADRVARAIYAAVGEVFVSKDGL